MSLEGKPCIVTGGFGALGSAVAKRLAARGARVAVIDRAPPPENSPYVCLGEVDLADPAAAGQAIDNAAVQLGGLYGLTNVAGGFRWEMLGDVDIATWDLLYTINLKTAVCACKAALPHFADGGRIVNIGTGAAAKAAAGMGAYAASKAGVAKLTEALAEELKEKRVTVNAILPSIIDTPANRKDMPKADFTKWVAPDQIAALIAFLLSEEAGAITGAQIPISGLL
jgi:NAD(P)-dependent dehydrogenase (short-subunit alcohol dehydrogenase family)